MWLDLYRVFEIYTSLQWINYYSSEKTVNGRDLIVRLAAYNKSYLMVQC